MDPFIENFKPEFEKSLEHLKEEIGAIRTGRASPALIENIIVDVYDSKMPIKQLASISVPEARMIVIEPWDKTILKEVEKAVRKRADISFSASSEDNIHRLSLHPLTEEDRQKLVKVLDEKLEKSRVAIRGIRDKVRGEIIKKAQNKEFTEDDKYCLLEELDQLADDYSRKIKEMGEEKEKKIMTI